jgi:hypothetical protein
MSLLRNGINSRQVERFCYLLSSLRPFLLPSGQTSWLEIQRSRVVFPALPNFLRSARPGTRSTQPREDNLGAILMKK